MAKVVQLDSRRKISPDMKVILDMSADFDSVIKDALARGIEIKTIAGVLAHRLANIIDHVDNRLPLWKMCHKIIVKLLFSPRGV